MKYTVICEHYGFGCGHPRNFRHGLTLTQAQGICTRWLRRGLRLAGAGTISRKNWGGWAGEFPRRYRGVTIYAEQREHYAPYKSRAIRRRQGWRD